VYDFKNANYFGVLVYLSRVVNGFPQVTQLVKDVDYFISETDKNITVLRDLVQGDSLTIKEYDQTYGSYVPNTPTKLGFYPASLPEVILDSTYSNPTYFIKGHDGSYTKLYGDYSDGALVDFRDKVLFEFETRIYNNLKVDAKIPLTADDVIPGQYRETEYTYEQVQQVYSRYFLNWVGLNRIDYVPQYYESTNEYTWNYSNCTSKVDQKKFKQGSWRGIFLWLYDTINPDTRPWEMLGLTNKPTWWDTRYGEFPYTSDNDLLWQDIENGFIWNDGQSYTNEKRKRPNLIIPVDSNGRLMGPFTSLVASYDMTKLHSEWKIGDMGPAEFAYMRSSSWPFDLMRILALTKPAQYFTLGMDLDVYKFNAEFDQYLVYNRFRTTPTDLAIYGADSSSAAHSYFNWVVDYLRQYGVDGSATVKDIILSLDVRLTYRVAGFTDKSLLSFYVEKGSPNSKNTSLLIPDESYGVLLYDNQPSSTIAYSSIIVQRTENGYKVYGNSQDKAYFVTAVPLNNGVYDTIDVGNLTVKVAKEYQRKTVVVPYGAEFVSVGALAEFIKGYGEHLVQLGMKFTDTENGLELNWNQMIAEFMYWVQSGWDVGSTVNINPCANTITINQTDSIVQPLTMHKENFLLNQNLIPIQIKDLVIYRNGTEFSAKTLNPGDSISLFRANLNNIEHVVVFDNYTVFNDVLFNLVTGLRQQRLYVKGTKSAEWNGTLNAAGFILNQDNVVDWQPHVKYVKGNIITYKREYWMANKSSISPSSTFNPEDWIKTDYEQVQKGLLPNPSTRAFESTLYYDAQRANLETDGDILGYSLIGYRPRSYLADGNLDDVSQVNIYKNMIPNKGTKEVLTSLQGITLQQNTLNYTFNENWAIKTGEFGGVLTQNFVEFTLDENQLTGNPAIVSITQGTPVAGAHQNIPLTNIKNYGRSINSPNFLPALLTNEEHLPSAGYVSLDDISFTGYRFNNLSNANIAYLYKNDYIWIADKDGKWDVFTPVSLGISVDTVSNNLNDTATVVFSKPHGLSEKDPIGILNFDTRVNGFYLVDAIVNDKTILLQMTLPKSISVLQGAGLPFKLQSQRVGSAEDILNLPLLNAEYVKTKVWVDKNNNGDWQVLHKSPNYSNLNFNSFLLNSTTFGSQVAYLPKLGYFITDPGEGKMYQYKHTAQGFVHKDTFNYPQSYGASLAYNDDIIVIGAPHVPTVDAYGTPVHWSYLYVYRIVKNDEIESLIEEEIIPIQRDDVGGTIAISGDSQYIYANVPAAESVLVFKKDNTATYYPVTYNIVTPITVPGMPNPINVDVTHTLKLGANTNVGDKFFVCSGNQENKVPQGKRVVFSNFSEINGVTLFSPLVPNTTYFKVNNNISSIVPGDNIAFPTTGINHEQDDDIYHEIYTIVSRAYDSVNNCTVFNIAQALAEPTATPVGTHVYKADMSEVVTVITSQYDADADVTTFFLAEHLSYSTASNTRVCTVSTAYTNISALLNTPFNMVGDGFGTSIATNQDSSKVFIGSPTADFSVGVGNTGRVFCFDRLVQTWEVQYDSKPTDFYVLVLGFAPDEDSVGAPLNTKSTLYVDGVKLDPSKYVILHNIVIMGPQKAGTIISLSSNKYVITQQLSSYENIYGVRPGQQFGYSLACNATGSELLVGAPYNLDDNNVEGAVYRFTHSGKRFGRITALAAANLVDPTYILLNGYSVPLIPETVPASRIQPDYNCYTITTLGTTDWIAIGAESAADGHASISGTTMTVDAVTYGRIALAGQVASSSIASGTLINTQLTSSVVPYVTTTASGYKLDKNITVASNSYIVPRMYAVGTGIPANTRVELVDGNIVVLSSALTQQISSSSVQFVSEYSSTTSVTPGASGGKTIVMSSTTGLLTRQFNKQTGVTFCQLVNGTGIDSHAGVYLKSIDGNTVTLSTYDQYVPGNSIPDGYSAYDFYETDYQLTTSAAGSYTFQDLQVDILRPAGQQVIFGTTVTIPSAGASGAKLLPVASTLNIIPSQIISGTGIPPNTYVKSVTVTNSSTHAGYVTMTNALSASATGTYLFKQSGATGTYSVSISQSMSARNFNLLTLGTVFTTPSVENGFVTPTGTGEAMESASAFVVAKQINDAAITNIFAYATEDGRLAIRLRDLNLNQLNNKLSISEFNGNYLYELGISEYTKTQVIKDPHNQQKSQFGHTVKFNQYNSFAVGAPVSDRFIGTQFDFSDDDNTHNDTVFDNNMTQFQDVFAEGGSVYIYDYVQSYNESAINPGQYVFSQSCNDNALDFGANPKYGSSLAFNDYGLIIGSPNFKPSTVGGKATVFENASNVAGWNVYKSSSPIVDVNKIQKTQLYSNLTDSMEVALDYIDPLQGKLLGAVRENIDVIASADPAGYNNSVAAKGNMVWAKEQVGKIWFDVTSVKFMNYHQSDMEYNSKYWGKVFPGSDVAVYSWIESDVEPALYVGVGQPYDLQTFTVTFQSDATGNLVAKYYYWVRDTNALFSQRGKTLTDVVISRYIADPQQSGIAYLAPLSQNVFGLYNARDYLHGTHTNIHLGFSETNSDIPNHAEFKLIRTEFEEDFLPGFPNKVQGYTSPVGLYEKMIDSLAGEDLAGAVIPDPYLPKLQQIGINIRPRQGMFVNRYEALRNYFQYANEVMLANPINEFGNLSMLTATGDTYNVPTYWENVYWWATGYNDKTKSAFEVSTYSDLLRISAKEGLIVGVASNSMGNR
jgi:hypothetical protein